MALKNNNLKKKISTLLVCAMVIANTVTFSFADGARVVTLGADLTDAQKQTMLEYFGVNENEVVVLEVNNQDERKYLQGIASEAQLGKKTYSCAYVEPTSSGSGINVKTANLTWLSSSMVASTLSTAGLTDADVVVASVFPVSGTGALTGIMLSYEDATGEQLDEEKKEIASEELIITGDIAEDIGADKAAGLINDIKTEIIKDGTMDTTQIAETINNVVNNYNITLSTDQQAQLETLMEKISEQDYDYNEMKSTLKGIKSTIKDKLKEAGESVDEGFLESIKDFLVGIGTSIKEMFASKKDSILDSTNDIMLGANAIIDATDEKTINLPSSEQVEGFFAKLWNWFTGLFKSNNTNVENNVIENAPMDSTIEAPVDNDLLDSMEENSTIEENVVPDNIENNIDELEEELEKEIKTENNVKDNIVENIEENTLENN